MSPDHTQRLHNSLDALVREADAMGISHTDAIKAILTWSVEQTYDTGGYPYTRLVLLDVLEHILLLDITNKNAA
ncbi:MAG: hypothetical protein P8Y67_09725 [Alphaproteobacteria bacterium]